MHTEVVLSELRAGPLMLSLSHQSIVNDEYTHRLWDFFSVFSPQNYWCRNAGCATIQHVTVADPHRHLSNFGRHDLRGLCIKRVNETVNPTLFSKLPKTNFLVSRDVRSCSPKAISSSISNRHVVLCRQIGTNFSTSTSATKRWWNTPKQRHWTKIRYPVRTRTTNLSRRS